MTYETGCSSSNPKETGEQNPSSPPWIPLGLNSDDFSNFYMMYEREGGGQNLDDYIKQQQQALDLLELTNSFAQKSQLGTSSQEEIEGDAEGYKNTENFENYFIETDTDIEDIDPIEELIFELEISDENRLLIPYPLASRYFPPMLIKPNTKETLRFHDPLRNMWEMTLIFDINTHNYIITNGWSRYLEHHNLIPSDLVRVYLPIPQENYYDFYIQHQKIFGEPLFEVVVPRSNRLVIPYDFGKIHFEPLDPRPPLHHLTEYTLYLTDFLDCKWKMRYVYYGDEYAYIIVRGWDIYAAHHGLKYQDTVRFYKGRSGKEGNNFVISAELTPALDFLWIDSYDEDLLCIRENLLFELDLLEGDVKFGRLKMPGVEFSFECCGKEMVKLIDQKGKDWYVIIVYQSDSKEYMIIDGWVEIVREHQLEAGDMVRFFVPVDPDHDKHFLLEFAKKKKNDMEKEEGCSGLGKPDDGAGPSYKGKGIDE